MVDDPPGEGAGSFPATPPATDPGQPRRTLSASDLRPGLVVLPPLTRTAIPAAASGDRTEDVFHDERRATTIRRRPRLQSDTEIDVIAEMPAFPGHFVEVEIGPANEPEVIVIALDDGGTGRIQARFDTSEMVTNIRFPPLRWNDLSAVPTEIIERSLNAAYRDCQSRWLAAAGRDRRSDAGRLVLPLAGRADSDDDAR